MIGSLIVRLITISFGYFLAVFAASVFLSFGLFSEYFSEFYQGLDTPHYMEEGSLILIGSYIALIVGWTALLPASILIAVAELMRWTGMTINLILGGICALFTGLAGFQGPADTLPSDSTLIVLMACGFIGGFAYWLVAGRSAGNWLKPKPAKSS